MSFDIYTNPNLINEVKKFLRVEDTIYVGPVGDGHQDIADHFGINTKVRELKKDKRADVDGGFIEVSNMDLAIKFDNESGTYKLNFHPEARQQTVALAQELSPGYGVEYTEASSFTNETVVQQEQVPDFYDRDNSESFYNVRKPII